MPPRSDTRPSKRPLITANMVTFARLVPMPVVCWLAYRGEIWIALILGILIGCTDFVDGYLARRHGPTVLGGLMDPIADKVFIAFAYLPFTDLGMFPAWAVALMFVRELMVTALRSSYELRDLRMKTSYLGKVKTWTQMQGIGMMMLFVLLRDHRAVMLGLLVTAMIAPLIALAALWIVKKRFWTSAVIMSAMCGPLIGLHFHDDLALTIEVLIYLVVLLTWVSGIDYVVVGLRQLRGRGDFGQADAVRLLGAVTLPFLLFAALVETSASGWPIVFILALELAVGGLDNLLSHHRRAAGALAWGLRVLGVSLLLALSIVFDRAGQPLLVQVAVGVALAVSAIGVAREFWRGADCYLDRTKREEALGDLPGASAGTA